MTKSKPIRYQVIDAAAREVVEVEALRFENALQRAGLRMGAVDHGVISPRCGIAVHEFGLYEPAETQCFFAILGRLYAGNAVLYGMDRRGETVDLPIAPDVRFFNAGEAEIAIAALEIGRPALMVDGVVIWQWPAPRPAGR